MITRIWALILFLHIIFVTFLHAQVFDGFTLFSTYDNTQNSSLLISNNQNVIHTWEHENGPASMPYLMPDSSIIYPYKVQNPSMVAGGVGGGIQRIKWNETIMWNYTFSDSVYQHHNDIEVMPNGNVLIIVWERKNDIEAYSAGRQTIESVLNEIWASAILELEPETGDIVWEWHIWDHLIQDLDPSLLNYGIVSEHPELMDINYGNIGDGDANADWMHINSVDYNSQLDQIVISSRNMNEFYIIDHSTTNEEVSSHTGGLYNKGGDFLYRWGNPEVYNRGNPEDKKLYGQHDVTWIEDGYPGYGSLILYNNGQGRPDGNYSSVDVITPIIEENGNYSISSNLPFLPEELSWTFIDNGLFYSGRQSGAQRLPNGNTLITVAYSNRIFEVSLEGAIIWDYNINGTSIGIPRARKYDTEYLNSNNLSKLNDGLGRNFKLIQNFPNPFNPVTTLQYDLPEDALVNITIYDMMGRIVSNLVSSQQNAGYKSIQWDATNNAGQPVSAGLYLYTIQVGKFKQTKKMVLLK